MKRYLHTGHSRQKIFLLIVATFVLTACIVLSIIMLRSPDLYKKSKHTAVGVDRIRSPESAVYYLGDNKLMIRLVKNPFPEVYVLDTATKIVGYPPGNEAGLLFLPGYVYCIHGVPSITLLNGTSSKVDNFNAELSIDKNRYEFRTLSGDLIDVTMSS